MRRISSTARWNSSRRASASSIFKGEDAYRPLTERVEDFARRYTDKVTVLDAAAFEMPGVSQETRALISPVILATILERLSAHLAVKRNHR